MKIPGSTILSETSRVRLASAAMCTGLVLSCTPLVSPPLALALGLAIALTTGNPFKRHTGKLTKYLLQASVVGLGFGMDFGAVLRAGGSGLLFTAATIGGTLAAGWLIGRWLSVNRNTAHLISSGTAICGGSAIAAMAPIIGATEKEISVSLGTVFILNSVALFVFPAVGHYFHLTQQQFGLWAAIAIHDTSSVVGAASRYGTEALQLATTVKLARALWIIPLSLAGAALYRKKSSAASLPWFILFFLLASAMVSLLPTLAPAYGMAARMARTGLTATLFLIGAGLSRETIISVGHRPVLQGTLLWLLVSVISFLAVTSIL